MWNLRSVCTAATGSVLIALTGCNVGGKYVKPVAPAPPAFKEQTSEIAEQNSHWIQSHPRDAADKGKWWLVFDDPQLNQLESQLEAGNQTLAQYEAQFQEARAAITIARSALFPILSANLSVANYADSENQTGVPKNLPIPGLNGTTNNTFNLSGVLSWEPDLWGSVRDAIRQQKATAEASQADLANIRLEMEAELATDYLGLEGQNDLIQLLTDTVKGYRQYLDLTEGRYNGGIASNLDVESAKTQLATARTQLKDAGIQRAQYEHAIALLLGLPPSALPALALTTLREPPPLPAALPSTVIERRSDVAAAERRVAAANAQVGEARAAFFPALVLNAEGGLQGNHLSNWLLGPSRFWSIGPSAAETLFDGGKRRATVAQNKSAYEASVSVYRQTVLTAFQEVEDSLAIQRILGEEKNTAAESVRSAKAQLDLTLDRYQHGTENSLDVTTAQNQLLASEQITLSIRTRAATNTVRLVKAIGGSWTP